MKRLDKILFSGVVLVLAYLISSILPILLNNSGAGTWGMWFFGILIAISYNASSALWSSDIDPFLLAMLFVGTLLIIVYSVWSIFRIYKSAKPELRLSGLIVLGFIITTVGVGLNAYASSSYSAGGGLMPYLLSPLSLVLACTGIAVLLSCIVAFLKLDAKDRPHAKKAERGANEVRHEGRSA